MSVLPRSVTLSAIGWEGGVRLYTQSGNGDFREACNNVPLSEFAQSPFQTVHDRAKVYGGFGFFGGISSALANFKAADQSEDWFPGDCHFTCDKSSTLCGIYASGYDLGVFYQNSSGNIRLHWHHQTWQDRSFAQPAMLGTDIAALISTDMSKCMVFYQASDGSICYRRARNWIWEAPVVLEHANPGCGLAVTTWRQNDLGELRFYYQEDDNRIVEMCGGFDGGWFRGGFSKSLNQPVHSLAAISWPRGDGNGFHVRVYVQNGNRIDEQCWDGSSWYSGSLPGDNVLPNSDIAAIVRLSSPERAIINIYWAGADQVLQQKVCSTQFGWLAPTPIAYLKVSNNAAGRWDCGSYFHDIASKIEDKTIRKIRIRAGAWIDALGLEFTDGSTTPMHGGLGGGSYEFVLNDYEDISQMSVVANGEHIQRIKFNTSQGRQSQWYGNDGETWQAQLWQLDEQALAGFAGQSGDFLYALMPLWSQRRITGPALLGDLIREADSLQQQSTEDDAKSSSQQRSFDSLSNDLDKGLLSPESEAQTSLDTLARKIIDFSRVGKDDVHARVTSIAICKKQSKEVGAKYQRVHDVAAGYMDRSAKLLTETTYSVSSAQSRQKRIDEIRKILAAIKVYADMTLATCKQRVRDAEESTRKARETKEEAERKKSGYKTTRVLRDIFTLGFGELGDWGGINEAIDYANKLIGSCEADLRRCQEEQRNADSQASTSQSTIDRFSTLGTTLDKVSTTLKGIFDRCTTLRDKIQSTINRSLDLSLVLSTIAAHSQAMDTRDSAQKLAKAFMALDVIMDASASKDASLKMLYDDEDELERAVKAIAETDTEGVVVPDF